MIRRIRPEEGAVLREVVLAALADSPEAFEAEYATEAARPASYWDERARAGSAGEPTVILLAERDEKIVGMVRGYHSTSTPGARGLAQLWVAPPCRGSGVGDGLVRAVIEWARQGGADAVRLWVVPGNRPAERLYARHGFVVCGGLHPVTDDPTVKVYRPMMLSPLPR